MKVCILENAERPPGTATHEEASLLRDAKLDVCVVGPGRPDSEGGPVPDGCRWVRVASPRGRLRRVRFYWSLFRAAVRLEADYYHAHRSLLLMILAWLAALLNRAVFVADFNTIIVVSHHAGRRGRAGSFDIFEHAEHWRAPTSTTEQSRMAAVEKIIPESVETLLDVGCGDGRITNRIARMVPHVAALDCARTPLETVEAAGTLGRADCLPFGTRAVDMVLATEVIEHLRPDQYEAALSELERVARQYIVVGVPLEEQLAGKDHVCPVCRHKFNVSGHLRRFSKEGLRDLFQGFRPVRFVECGAQQSYYYHPWLLWIRQRLGGGWARPSYARCPQCGVGLSPTGLRERNAVTRWCDRMNAGLRRKRRPSASHVLALYERMQDNCRPGTADSMTWMSKPGLGAADVTRKQRPVPASPADAAGSVTKPAGGKMPRPLRVLHVLAVSLPHLNGYTVRSKYIVETQRRLGLQPIVVTSPFYPGNDASVRNEVINGVGYHRVPHPADMERPLAPEEFVCRWVHRFRVGLSRGPLFFRCLRGVIRMTAVRCRDLGRGYLQKLAELVCVCLRTGVERPRKGAAMGVFLVLAGLARFGRYVVRRVYDGTSFLSRLLGRGLNRLAGLANNILHGFEELLLLRRFERHLGRIVRRVKPDVIHAHSPYRCGLPAAAVARRRRVPFVYEVRGLWEESGVAAGNFQRNSRKYLFWRKKETEVMRGADAVVCLCGGLRSEVIRRGVDPACVTVVPNAVTTTVFDNPVAVVGEHPAGSVDPIESVRRRLRGRTLGYVGSLRKLEGVDGLVRGAAELARRGEDISLLIVGDGVVLEELKLLAAELHISDRTVFTGSVPHHRVRHYYDMIDIFVISRPALRVTEIVTPLKPLEAMAMGKPIVVSDLPALREIVADGQTGLVYRSGNAVDLADQCRRLLRNPQLYRDIAEAGRNWVRQERTWAASLRPLGLLYEMLGSAPETAA